jgi:hypothetical protein
LSVSGTGQKLVPLTFDRASRGRAAPFRGSG